jgi:hypothetical protein
MAKIKFSISGKEYSLLTKEFITSEDACRIDVSKTSENLVFLLGLSNEHFLDLMVGEESIFIYIPISSIKEISW